MSNRTTLYVEQDATPTPTHNRVLAHGRGQLAATRDDPSVIRRVPLHDIEDSDRLWPGVSRSIIGIPITYTTHPQIQKTRPWSGPVNHLHIYHSRNPTSPAAGLGLGLLSLEKNPTSRQAKKSSTLGPLTRKLFSLRPSVEIWGSKKKVEDQTTPTQIPEICGDVTRLSLVKR